EISATATAIATALRVALTAILVFQTWAMFTDRRARDGLRLASWIALWLLLVPSLSWTHYFLPLLPIVLVLYERAEPSRRREMALGAGIAIALVSWPLFPSQRGVLGAEVPLIG